jgi:hypothetical protein
MEQVCGARAGAREQLYPGSNEPFVGRIVDGGKDAIGRLRAILVGGLEGPRSSLRSQWLRRPLTARKGRMNAQPAPRRASSLSIVTREVVLVDGGLGMED